MPAIVSHIVEVCVFRTRGRNAEYLLLRRSGHDTLYPGIWQFVTGTMDSGEHAVKAALRELEEETGLRPLHFWTVPYASVFYDRLADAMNLCPMFAAEVGESQDPRLSVEHETFAWLPAKEAVRRLVWPGQRRGLEIVEQYIVGGEAAKDLGLIPL